VASTVSDAIEEHRGRAGATSWRPTVKDAAGPGSPSSGKPSGHASTPNTLHALLSPQKRIAHAMQSFCVRTILAHGSNNSASRRSFSARSKPWRRSTG